MRIPNNARTCRISLVFRSKLRSNLIFFADFGHGYLWPLRALKVVAYSYTPAWVAGVLHLVPSLGALVLLATLYGLYVMYLGLPVLMRTPAEKAMPYTAVVVVCAILVFFVLGALSMCVGGMGAIAM